MTHSTIDVSETVPTKIKPSKTITFEKDSEKKAPIIVTSVVEVIEENKSVAKQKLSKQNKSASSKIEILPEKKHTALPSKKEVISKVDAVENKPILVSSQVQTVVNPIKTVSTAQDTPIIYSSIVEIHSSSDNLEPVVVVENNIGEPEYDFLSRQAEYAEESYRVVNLRPTQKRQKTSEAKRTTQNNHPTGLVTKLGGTVVNDGITTVHETSVIGTSISGKYAQILQSTSHIFANNAKIKPSQSSSLRILKTAAPSTTKTPKYSEPEINADDEGLAVEAYGNNATPNLVRASRRPVSSSNSFKNRFKSNSKDKEDVEVVQPAPSESSTYGGNKKSVRNRNGLNKNKR